MTETPYTRFLTDPDPQARRVELITFVGPNPKSFLALYDYLTTRADKGTLDAIGAGLSYNGFSAPAFFLGPVWFFYRKMWFWGFGYVAAMVLLSAFPATNRASVALGIGMALIARWAYLHHAIVKIMALRRDALQDEQTFLRTIARAGGVSTLAGWVSGILFATAVALAVIQAHT